MSRYPHLFSPFTVGNMQVKNRIFMSPVGTHLATEDYGVTEALLAYYEARARGGAGFITTECVLIAPNTRYTTFHNMGLFEDAHIDEMRKIPDRVHPYGAKIGVQLMHPASLATPEYNEGIQPVSSSPIENRAVGVIPREVTVEELQEIVLQFGQAALRAQKAGFDAVEIHCCHNHGLLGKFLSPIDNRRIDEYGGTVEGRLRLPLEVIAQVRAQVGKDFPVIVRMSCTDAEPGGQSLMEARYIARRFEQAGVSMIHMSDGNMNGPWNTTAPSGASKAFNAEFAADLKSCVSIPVGFIGRMNEPWIGDMVIEQGKGDVVYMGRALLCDPEFPNKAMAGQEDRIRPCIGCNHCLVSINSDQVIQCTMNPQVGQEAEPIPDAANTPAKRLLVLGGGPAGLTAAAWAAEWGHTVTLAEKADRLGGQMYLAAFPPCKQDLAHGTKYMIDRCRRAGVDIRCGADSAAEIASGNYDAVILATGGAPVMPVFPGGANALVSAWDALEGKHRPGVNTVIVGGGLVGCETADFLLHPCNDLNLRSRKVTLLEMAEMVGAEEKSSFRPLMIQRLLAKGCNIITGAKVVEVGADYVTYEKDGECHTLSKVDTVISAVGVRRENALKETLHDAGIPHYVVGDAKKARNIVSATREGYQAVKAWQQGNQTGAKEQN